MAICGRLILMIGGGGTVRFSDFRTPVFAYGSARYCGRSRWSQPTFFSADFPLRLMEDSHKKVVLNGLQGFLRGGKVFFQRLQFIRKALIAIPCLPWYKNSIARMCTTGSVQPYDIHWRLRNSLSRIYTSIRGWTNSGSLLTVEQSVKTYSLCAWK